MRYNPSAPYNILATDRVDFAAMQRLSRFARYWELVANSGRFTRSIAVLLGDAPFARFLAFSDFIFAKTGKTHEIAVERLYDFIYYFLTERLALDASNVRLALIEDYQASGARGKLSFLEPVANSATQRRSQRISHRAKELAQ